MKRWAQPRAVIVVAIVGRFPPPSLVPRVFSASLQAGTGRENLSVVAAVLGKPDSPCSSAWDQARVARKAAAVGGCLADGLPTLWGEAGSRALQHQLLLLDPLMLSYIRPATCEAFGLSPWTPSWP